MSFNQFLKICPVCLQESKISFITNKDNTFSLFECTNCEVQFWSPFQNPGHAWYEAQEKYRCKNPRLYRGYHKTFLKLHTNFPPDARVLDIGCGTGVLLAQLHEKGYDVWGVDSDRLDIEVARRCWGLRNLFAMSFDDFFQKPDLPQFDVITFFEVIEHLDNPLEFIGKVKRILKPDGCIVLSTPSRERMLPNLYEWDFPPYHLSRWNEAAICKLFRRVGFEMSFITYTDQYIHFVELFSALSKKIAKAAGRSRLAMRLQHCLLVIIPARILWLIGKIINKRNGVMVIGLVPKEQGTSPGIEVSE